MSPRSMRLRADFFEFDVSASEQTTAVDVESGITKNIFLDDHHTMNVLFFSAGQLQLWEVIKSITRN